MRAAICAPILTMPAGEPKPGDLAVDVGLIHFGIVPTLPAPRIDIKSRQRERQPKRPRQYASRGLPELEVVGLLVPRWLATFRHLGGGLA
jgi:hypothetical protein